MDIFVMITLLLSIAAGKAILARAQRREILEDTKFTITTRITKYAPTHAQK